MGRHPSRRNISPEDIPVGVRIRNRRREAGLTQTQLAGGVYTKSFISQMESGHADPSVDTLRYLGRRLQMALSSMAGDRADMHLAALEGLMSWAHEAWKTGRVDAARRAIEMGIEIAAAHQWRRRMADACLMLAEVEIEAGDRERAAGALRRVPEQSVLPDPRVAIRRDLAEGLLALRAGELPGATEAFSRALRSARRSARHADLAVRALEGLAEALARAGSHAQAQRRKEAVARLAARLRA